MCWGEPWPRLEDPTHSTDSNEASYRTRVTTSVGRILSPPPDEAPRAESDIQYSSCKLCNLQYARIQQHKKA